MCFAQGKTKQAPCSVCKNWVNPGTIWAPVFDDMVTDLFHAPPGRAYFCGSCFRITRPKPWCCICTEATEWYVERGRQIGRMPVQTPPGPPSGFPPPGLPAGRPGPPSPPPWPQQPSGASSDAGASYTFLQPYVPGHQLSLPTPQPPCPNVGTSSAPSLSSWQHDYENPVVEVERLRQEVTELKEKLSVLENIVQALQNANMARSEETLQNAGTAQETLQNGDTAHSTEQTP